jgi:hypothetical protein
MPADSDSSRLKQPESLRIKASEKKTAGKRSLPRTTDFKFGATGQKAKPNFGEIGHSPSSPAKPQNVGAQLIVAEREYNAMNAAAAAMEACMAIMQAAKNMFV